ncbi:DNA-processing protein DprA [Methylocystis parvus]|uniref:DNA-protecting protein DprA n=1 Tax=Methylocystis parvus TaxID=134 RepID=A0A6B8M964_9HYPH|nr:DNA-processing protein DprA [Methylocystis parvus]QGM98945.1 DNA-protecting protein DprA [Methylocystis parvus]WBK00697.1 DNA-processing protein DprA [Methylocystis parvus OBBP]
MSGATSGARLSDEQLVDWLRLIRSENIGPRTFRELVNRYGGARAALDALPGLAAKSLRGRAIRIAPRDEILREIDRAFTMGVRFVATGDPDYPSLLREIPDAPPILSIRGVGQTAGRDGVALVGSRNASAAGLAFAERLARSLARADYVIVSGLARGIDAVAHRATLETGTIAVLAGGQARPYPSEHERLVAEIAEQGLLVSEMPLEWEPRGRDFPRRNRIISGVSRATVVVEAARRSGSLITARFANEQGREVFAVPGSPLDPRAEGTNDLLRQGATLCARPEDVIDALAAGGSGAGGALFDDADQAPDEEPLFDELDLFPPQGALAFEEPKARPPDFSKTIAPEPIAAPEASRADARELVMSLLGPAPVAVDELIRIAGLTARDVQSVLVELDLDGRLERHGSNVVSLVYNQK